MLDSVNVIDSVDDESRPQKNVPMDKGVGHAAAL